MHIDVPGSWFADGAVGRLNAAERREKYTAIAVEYDAAHVFNGIRGRRGSTSKSEAIRFLCPDDAAEEANHAGYWMRLDAWNRYRNDTYRDRREDELQYIPNDEYERAAAAVRAGAQAAQPGGGKPVYKPPVYEYFKLVSVGTHEIITASAGVKSVPCEYYECKKKGRGCRVKGAGDEVIKVVQKGTGGLLKHLRVCEGEEVWLRVRAASKHSKVVLDESGALVKKYTFKELLEHHIRFVIYCFMNWKHFNAARSPEFVDYITGFDKRLGVPARETCVKIINIINYLLKKNLHSLLGRMKEKLGSPFFGYLDDIWSKRRCRQSFACARVAIGVDGDFLDEIVRASSSEARAKGLCFSGQIVRCSPLLAFQTLPSARHHGRVIAKWKEDTLKEASLSVKDIRCCCAVLCTIPAACAHAVCSLYGCALCMFAACARRMGQAITRRATRSCDCRQLFAIRTICNAAC